VFNISSCSSAYTYCLNYAGCKVVQEILSALYRLSIALTMRDVKRKLHSVVNPAGECIALTMRDVKRNNFHRKLLLALGIALTMRDVKGRLSAGLT